ncbi:MAG: aldo/keto reductase [Crenarchaeota archaeon]|nr:aldo/keto reductase [Thermoproteota archaeon]MCR8453666.1 aldo/keto reductase [Thermoproteota archaeon]MCR8455367.1 aldo/keto reductase [Thermoproteota archaeon]MCR8462924.1 aldo/keto reductase [Thermoproteota archaeon]MCR8470396.1 aldo/keto reductase [Thermoproteota archaeon]
MIDTSDLKPIKGSMDKIPAIGMGTWRIGGNYAPNYSKDSLWIDALKFGIGYSIEKVGLALIDTAELYGAGHSEELVGKSLRGFSREEVFITTKVKPENLSYNKLVKAAEGSLRRLQTDYIDLYLVHWPNPRIPISETMRAMEKLYNDGLIRYIGVSNFDKELLEEARSYLSVTDIVVNQVKYSLLDRSAEKEIIPYCQKEGIIIMAYTPLERGEVLRLRNVIKLAEKYGKTPAQIALNWLISKPLVVAIPKSENRNHIKENIDTMGWRLSEEDLKILED